jgi:ABC-2 type transport system ATP-binding protein
LLTEVEQVCNKVGIIHEGRFVRVDDLSTASELLTNQLGIPVNKNGAGILRIDAEPDRIPALNAALVAHGINVYELTPIKESLEEAFIRLIDNGGSST